MAGKRVPGIRFDLTGGWRKGRVASPPQFANKFLTTAVRSISRHERTSTHTAGLQEDSPVHPRGFEPLTFGSVGQG